MRSYRGCARRFHIGLALVGILKRQSDGIIRIGASEFIACDVSR